MDTIFILIELTMEKAWHLTPVLLPGKTHGRKAAVHGVAEGRT